MYHKIHNPWNDFFFYFILRLQNNVLTWVAQLDESLFIHLFLLWAETWLNAYTKCFAIAVSTLPRHSGKMLLPEYPYWKLKFSSILMDYNREKEIKFMV